MQDSKLVSLLKYLDSRELSCFSDFVHSPFYNKHKQVRRLCDYLCKYVGNPKKAHRLKIEKVHRYVYPKKEFERKNMHIINNKLLSLLHDFLVLTNNEDSPRTHLIKVLAELRQRKQFKDYKAVLRKIERRDKEDFEHIEDRYWQQFNYHKELDVNFLTKGGRSYDENLQLKNDFLDLFFITKKLKIACDMVSRNKVIGSDYEFRLVDELFVYLEQADSPYADAPSIKVYAAILKMLVHWQEDSYYPVVKKLLKKHNESFSKSELHGMYDFALNFCIWRHNQDTGSNHYLQEMFDIYKFVVEQRIIFIDGFLPPWEYKTIVTTGITLGELDYVHQFIEAYKESLPTDIRQSAYSYNLAFLLYSKQDYKGALQTLYDVVFTNWTYHIGAKMIQLRSYFELEEGEALYSLVDAVRSYLNRNKAMPQVHKTIYYNFIKIVKKAFRLKDRKGFISPKKYNKQAQKLWKAFQETNPIASKVWLKEAIEELLPEKIE